MEKRRHSPSAPASAPKRLSADGSPPTPRGALAAFDTRNAVVQFDDSTRHVPEIHVAGQQRLAPDGSVTQHRVIKPNTTLLVDAGCALGKSTQFLAFVRRVLQEKPSARVLCLSSRIIHAHDLCADYADCPVKPAMYKDYKRKETELVKQQFVILSLELAFYLQHCDAAFDVLILDEARSLCDKFALQTTLRHPGCFEQLRIHYARATYVLAADADCGVDNAVTYLLQMEATRPVVTWRLPHQRLKRRLTVYFRPNNNEPPAEFRRVKDKNPKMCHRPN
jgi:hypothetical protein